MSAPASLRFFLRDGPRDEARQADTHGPAFLPLPLPRDSLSSSLPRPSPAHNLAAAWRIDPPLPPPASSPCLTRFVQRPNRPDASPRPSVLPHACPSLLPVPVSASLLPPSLLLNQLVVFSSRKRANQRYGAGRKREKGRPKPSRPTTPSKTPGRRNRLEASGATSPPRTAPYRRFARFSADFSTT